MTVCIFHVIDLETGQDVFKSAEFNDLREYLNGKDLSKYRIEFTE